MLYSSEVVPRVFQLVWKSRGWVKKKQQKTKHPNPPLAVQCPGWVKAAWVQLFLLLFLIFFSNRICFDSVEKRSRVRSRRVACRFRKKKQNTVDLTYAFRVWYFYIRYVRCTCRNNLKHCLKLCRFDCFFFFVCSGDLYLFFDKSMVKLSKSPPLFPPKLSKKSIWIWRPVVVMSADGH